MYLAPRCRLICPRCSTRSRVESVHLRFLYVSWVQIDVSQIGLFSKPQAVGLGRPFCSAARGSAAGSPALEARAPGDMVIERDAARAVRKEAPRSPLDAPRKAGPSSVVPIELSRRCLRRAWG